LNAGRVTVVGLGNTLRRDDGVGIAVVRELRALNLSCVQLIEDEAVPEDRIPEIELFKPTHVLIIDAALLGLSPGSIVFRVSLETSRTPVSTHALPLRLFAEYLEQNLSSKVALLLIEPLDINFGEGVTGVMQKASSELAAILISILRAKECQDT
jgi:hydrogenase 3 maturation protease